MPSNKNCLDFDWEKDIQSAFEPPSYTVQPRPVNPTDPKDDRYWPVGGDSFRLVQADPDDILHLSDQVLGERHYHVNKMIWMNTVDRYLFQYMLLAQRQNGYKEILLELPDVLQRKYNNYFDTSESRKKPIPPFIQLQKPDNKDSENGSAIRCVVPIFAQSAYQNLICRWLWSQSNSVDQQSSMYYDGIIMRLEGDGKNSVIDFVPKFSLMDYIQHEMLTGISLSIEMTAILLEIEDDDLKELALEAFCTKPMDSFERTPLDICARSPLLFTRNTVARNYFQQIILETATQKYEWKKTANRNILLREDTVKRAAKHVEILIPRINWEDVPDNQIQEAIDQIYKMLSQVTIPVNLPAYVMKPKHGLAVFCHPNHKNIEFFLQELAEKDRNRITSIPRWRTKAHKWFKKVHSSVKSAINKR